MYNITDTTVPSTSTRVLNRFYDLTTGEQELGYPREPSSTDRDMWRCMHA